MKRAYMDVLLPKLLRETLAERPQTELTSCERARGDVSTDGSRRASEEERASLAALVELVLLERKDGPAREREGRGDIGLQR